MTTTIDKQTVLPPGQQARADFPRFGVESFAKFRAPADAPTTLRVAGDVPAITVNYDDIKKLQRVESAGDFHCVTTWSYRGVTWSGFRFREVFEKLIQPQLPANTTIAAMGFKALDGYRAGLLLEDALAEDVLIADMLNGEPLTTKHGAPLRLIAPAHYGYKNVKHLAKIDLWRDAHSYRPMMPKFMEHPRGRLAYEERGRYFPGWLLRYAYRPLINSTVRNIERIEAENTTSSD
jgi:DMSO/TMAO reductase YedYZ molybdopterin-dependent catalytic subunit